MESRLRLSFLEAIAQRLDGEPRRDSSYFGQLHSLQDGATQAIRERQRLMYTVCSMLPSVLPAVQRSLS
jgi:hypothetical protein